VLALGVSGFGTGGVYGRINNFGMLIGLGDDKSIYDLAAFCANDVRKTIFGAGCLPNNNRHA
jgi:hypothetical protein